MHDDAAHQEAAVLPQRTVKAATKAFIILEQGCGDCKG